MKTLRSMCLYAAAAAMMVMSLPANADTFRTKAKVPFAFEVAGKMMPAGEYTISQTHLEGVLQVQSEEGVSVLVPVIDRVGTTNAVSPRLVFVEKNGLQHLKEIYLDGGTYGSEIPVK